MARPLSTAIIAFAALLAAPLAFTAPVQIGPCQVSPDGSFKVGGVAAKVNHFGPGWSNAFQSQGTVKADSGYPQFTSGSWTLKGSLALSAGEFSFVETLSKTSETEANYEVSVKSAKPVSSNELSLLLSLSVDEYAGREITVDGAKTALPVEFSKMGLFNSGSFQTLELLSSDAKLRFEGQGSILIQDDRQFNVPNYSIRIGFAPSKGEISEASFKMKITASPYDTKPVSLVKAMNMGFADDVAGDGKGGWSDQGPENDLRMIKPGLAKLGGVAFDIVDPAKNGGCSCVVFGADRIPGLAKSASVDAGGLSAKYLCVLHALAWPPSGKVKIGTIAVSYQDGSKKEVPVISSMDVGNWWSPNGIENGQVVWTGENKSSYVGLYMTSYPVDAKPIDKIEFLSEGNSEWMIVGLSGSNDKIPKTVNVPSYVVENKDWKPIEFPREVEKGSALDFSFLSDAPAGKHGRMIVSGGKLAFEDAPAKPVRLYGVNLCFTANFLDKEVCDKLADRLAGCGYNTVRFHHYDKQASAKDEPGTTNLDPANMDKLDYLFSALKKRGIYITTDLYVSRDIKKGEIPEIDRGLTIAELADYKALVPILDSAMKNWEEFSKSLLNHVNPYTGLAWKDDPALVLLSLVNENNIASCWNRSPEIKAMYEAKFAQWLAAKGMKEPASGERESLFSSFLSDTYNAAYARQKAFLLSLGVKTPFTDQNMCSDLPLTLMRDNYDYVDNHFYWDHPSFPVKPWSLPSVIQNKSVIDNLAPVPGTSFPTRVFGKPFTITEFNWAFPCAYRAESGAITGAYAALQDWDGLYRFAYSHSSKSIVNDSTSNYFDVATDPLTIMSDRIGVLLFTRRDVESSSLEIPIAVSQAWKGKMASYPRLSWQLGLLGKIGSVVECDGKFALPAGAKACVALDQSIPDGVKSVDFSSKDAGAAQVSELKGACGFGKGEFDVEGKRVRSSTGELEIDGKARTFKAVTPRSETFVLCDKGSLEGSSVSVENRGSAATVFVAALDGKSVKDSSRLLVLHLTDVMNSKIKFSDRKMTVLESSGTLPHLVRRGEAALKISLAPGSAPKVYAIDLAGVRMEETQSSFSQDGSLSFVADTFASKAPCMAYEIVR